MSLKNFLRKIHTQGHALKTNGKTFKFKIKLRNWVTTEYNGT